MGTLPNMAVFLAHQGGWDELIWFAVPIVAVVLWVRWAERRAVNRSKGSTGTAVDSASSTMPGETHT